MAWMDNVGQYKLHGNSCARKDVCVYLLMKMSDNVIQMATGHVTNAVNAKVKGQVNKRVRKPHWSL